MMSGQPTYRYATLSQGQQYAYPTTAAAQSSAYQTASAMQRFQHVQSHPANTVYQAMAAPVQQQYATQPAVALEQYNYGQVGQTAGVTQQYMNQNLLAMQQQYQLNQSCIGALQQIHAGTNQQKAVDNNQIQRAAERGSNVPSQHRVSTEYINHQVGARKEC